MQSPTLFDEIDAPRTLKEQFAAFHRENPQVFEMFERFALQAARTGRKHFGAKAVFERMRWYTAIETRGDEFRLNNNYTAFYARLFALRHPEHADFFRMREQRA